ncbi:MAG: hypothetical protein PHT43_07385 [Anaerolineaceae bacterium]|nr:hypothetical protein [Anaerolineaceae bacterium]NLC29576.1 hypothetical protein [Chloroflexota bacterium]
MHIVLRLEMNQPTLVFYLLFTYLAVIGEPFPITLIEPLSYRFKSH